MKWLRSTPCVNVVAPLGIAEYDLVKQLPEPLQTSLPTIEQIERELARKTQ